MPESSNSRAVRQGKLFRGPGLLRSFSNSDRVILLDPDLRPDLSVAGEAAGTARYGKRTRAERVEPAELAVSTSSETISETLPMTGKTTRSLKSPPAVVSK